MMKKIVLLCGFMAVCIGNHLFGQTPTGLIESRKLAMGELYYLGNERLTMRRLSEITIHNPLAHREIKLARTCNVFGAILGAAGGACIGYPLGTLIGGGQPNWVIAGVGAGFLLIGLPIAIAGDRHVAKGVALYNQGIQEASVTTVHLQLVFNPTGIGVVMRF
jgi:outer membrane lipoprotein SlyB